MSGTGPVVEGVQFTNGWCALRWISQKSSVCFYQSLDDVKKIHGHGGRTELIIHDFDALKRKQTTPEAVGFEALMLLIEEATHLMTIASESEMEVQELHGMTRRLHELVDRFERAVTPGPSSSRKPAA